jgi:tetratricopeptide (TPR) repeat protein
LHYAADGWGDASPSADSRLRSPAEPLRVTARRKVLFYALAWVLLVAGLFAKTTIGSLPAVILLVAWWRRGRLRWRHDVLPTLPFFAPAIVMCAVTGWLEKNHVGALGADYALTFSQRCLIAGRAFWFYLGKLLWPADLCFVYPRWQPNPADWRQWLHPAMAIALLLALWVARRRIGRGPVAAALMFTGTLVPVLGFVSLYYMRYSFVCDHWAYLSSVGPIALVASGASALLTRFRERRFLAPAAGAALLLTLGVRTWHEAAPYADVETLWRVTIRRNPGCWIAYTNLGNALFRRGKSDEAIADFREAIRLKPDLPEAYTSLGVALASRGQLDQAIDNFRDAIRLNPEYAEAHYDLGMALGRTGQLDAAIDQLREAVRLKPGFAAAKRQLGMALAQRADD